MIRQPDDPRPRLSTDQDRADPDGVAWAPVDAAADNELHGGTGSAEPVWVLSSIVLGLVALSGSLLLFATFLIVGIIVWLLSTPPIEQDRETFGQPWPGPFGGPGLPL